MPERVYKQLGNYSASDELMTRQHYSPRTNHFSRRTFLAGSAAATGTVAGCTDVLQTGSTGANEHVVLEKPDQYEDLRSARDDGALQFPIHGDRLPEVTVPAPLTGRDVTTTEFVGERHVLLTFIFTRCSDACPLLIAPLVHVQASSIENEFADDVAFLPMTFDPAYDTAERLAEYGEERGVHFDAGNWWFLRPETEQRAEDVVAGTFGVNYEFVPEAEREMGNMAWVHSNRLVFANAEGYVERTYTGEPPNPAAVLEDIETLRDRW